MALTKQLNYNKSANVPSVARSNHRPARLRVQATARDNADVKLDRRQLISSVALSGLVLNPSQAFAEPVPSQVATSAMQLPLVPKAPVSDSLQISRVGNVAISITLRP